MTGLQALGHQEEASVFDDLYKWAAGLRSHRHQVGRLRRLVGLVELGGQIAVGQAHRHARLDFSRSVRQSTAVPPHELAAGRQAHRYARSEFHRLIGQTTRSPLARACR